MRRCSGRTTNAFESDRLVVRPHESLLSGGIIPSRTKQKRGESDTTLDCMCVSAERLVTHDDASTLHCMCASAERLVTRDDASA